MIHDSVRAAREVVQQVSLEYEQAANAATDAIDENGEPVVVEPKTGLQGLMSFIHDKLNGKKQKITEVDIIGNIDTTKPVVITPAVVVKKVDPVVVKPAEPVVVKPVEVKLPDPVIPVPPKPPTPPLAYKVAGTDWKKPKKPDQPAALERKYKVKISGGSTK